MKFGLVVVPEHPADAPMVQMLDEAMLSASGGDSHA